MFIFKLLICFKIKPKVNTRYNTNEADTIITLLLLLLGILSEWINNTLTLSVLVIREVGNMLVSCSPATEIVQVYLQDKLKWHRLKEAAVV